MSGSHIPKAFKSKIISMLRKLSYSWKPRNEAKKEAQIGPNVFVCKHCECAVYEGTRPRDEDIVLWNGDFVVDYFKLIKRERGVMDHIIPIVKPEEGWQDWNRFVDGIFCPKENWQYLCKECHKIKTREEALIRKKSKLNKKST